MANHHGMIPLHDQETLEELLKPTSALVRDQPFVIIKFGAEWCGPCKRLDLPSLLASDPRVTWYSCDIDENDYSAGYCGVKTIPAFMAILHGKPRPLFQSSDTAKVIEWIRTL